LRSLLDIAQNIFVDGHKLGPDQIERACKQIEALSFARTSIVSIISNRSPEYFLLAYKLRELGIPFIPFDARYSNTSDVRSFCVEEGIRTLVEITNDGFFLEAISVRRECNVPPDTAYGISTSGTTGKPKVSLLSHQALDFLIQNTIKHFNIDEESRVCILASISFDASIFEFFGAAVSGANLHIISDEVKYNPTRLTQLLSSSDFSLVTLTPTLGSVIGNDFKCGSLKFVGEELSQDIVDKFATCAAKIFNAYGPTECGVWVTLNHCESDISIGRPLDNIHIKILDESGCQSKKGVLHVCTPGIHLGYLNQPDTSSNIVMMDGENYYNTNDIVELRNDGKLTFIERSREVLKINGIRVSRSALNQSIREFLKSDRFRLNLHHNLIDIVVEKTVEPFDADILVSRVQQAFSNKLRVYRVFSGTKYDNKSGKYRLSPEITLYKAKGKVSSIELLALMAEQERKYHKYLPFSVIQSHVEAFGLSSIADLYMSSNSSTFELVEETNWVEKRVVDIDTERLKTDVGYVNYVMRSQYGVEKNFVVSMVNKVQEYTGSDTLTEALFQSGSATYPHNDYSFEKVLASIFSKVELEVKTLDVEQSKIDSEYCRWKRYIEDCVATFNADNKVDYPAEDPDNYLITLHLGSKADPQKVLLELCQAINRQEGDSNNSYIKLLYRNEFTDGDSSDLLPLILTNDEAVSCRTSQIVREASASPITIKGVIFREGLSDIVFRHFRKLNLMICPSNMMLKVNAGTEGLLGIVKGDLMFVTVTSKAELSDGIIEGSTVRRLSMGQTLKI